jgi:hypothetical protein
VSSIVWINVTGTPEFLATGIPFGTWWPKAPNVLTDRWTPVTQAAYTSPLPGSGNVVASVRQERGDVGRWWRTWRIVPVQAARCSVRRATSTQTPQWASIAGLTSNPADGALDNPGWWWSQTLDGSVRFAAVDDEAQLTTTSVNHGVYRFVQDRDCPINMDAWRGLRAPTVEQYGPAGSTQRVEFAALWTGVGSL